VDTVISVPVVGVTPVKLIATVQSFPLTTCGVDMLLTVIPLIVTFPAVSPVTAPLKSSVSWVVGVDALPLPVTSVNIGVGDGVV
jgi:hypothetical protein